MLFRKRGSEADRPENRCSDKRSPTHLDAGNRMIVCDRLVLTGEVPSQPEEHPSRGMTSSTDRTRSLRKLADWFPPLDKHSEACCARTIAAEDRVTAIP